MPVSVDDMEGGTDISVASGSKNPIRFITNDTCSQTNAKPYSYIVVKFWVGYIFVIVNFSCNRPGGTENAVENGHLCL